MPQLGGVVQPGALGEVGAEELRVPLRRHPTLADPPGEPEPPGQLSRRCAADDGRRAPLALVHVGGQLVDGHTRRAYELLDIPHHTGILVEFPASCQPGRDRRDRSPPGSRAQDDVRVAG